MNGHAEGQIDRAVYRRFFNHRFGGTCLEIGAARPDWLSIGALFRGKGWDVLSVEPNPVFAAAHRKLGHDVAQVALSNTEADSAPFTVVDCEGVEYRDGNVSFESWSSLGVRGKFAEIGAPANQRTIAVRVCRADTLLAEKRPNWRGIDLVTIDIEGWELEALSGLDFDHFRPRAVVMENLFLERRYRDFMAERGYVLWRLSAPNEVYVRRDMLSTAERAVSTVAVAVLTGIHRARRMAGRVLRAIRRTVRFKAPEPHHTPG